MRLENILFGAFLIMSAIGISSCKIYHPELLLSDSNRIEQTLDYCHVDVGYKLRCNECRDYILNKNIRGS